MNIERLRALTNRTATWAAGNLTSIIFVGALTMASTGLGLMYAPLALAFPGVSICALMVAWRWRMTRPPRPADDDDGDERDGHHRQQRARLHVGDFLADALPSCPEALQHHIVLIARGRSRRSKTTTWSVSATASNVERT